MEKDIFSLNKKIAQLNLSKGGKNILLALGIFLILAIGWYLGKIQSAVNSQLKNTVTNKANSGQNTANIINPADARLNVTGTDAATEEIIKRVFRHVYLPGGEVKVETVIDAEKLKQVNPVFYQFVKAGDKLIIYPDRAILYDPTADQILDIIHFNASAQAKTEAQNSSTKKP